MELAGRVIQEAGVSEAKDYFRHVHRMAICYFLMFFVAATGAALLIYKSKIFVTLAQRSNVETLTIAFLLILFLYLMVLSARGAWGAFRIAYFWLLSLMLGQKKTEPMKARSLGKPRGPPRPAVALNIVFEKEGKPEAPVRFEVRDEHGTMGTLVIEGARLSHVEAHKDGFNTLFAYLVERLQRLLHENNIEREIEIVEWRKLDNEECEKYLSMVDFARNLSMQFNGKPFWPTVQISDAQVRRIEGELSQVCRAVRSEGLLPDWEYSGEHKLPIIPEPLGIISLSRNEKRVDPLSSMGAALAVVLFTVMLAFLMVFHPPWVPGK